jgi:hypothetical protein
MLRVEALESRALLSVTAPRCNVVTLTGDTPSMSITNSALVADGYLCVSGSFQGRADLGAGATLESYVAS